MLFVEKLKNINRVQKVLAAASTIIAIICLLQINVLNTYLEPVVYTLTDKTIDLELNCQISDTVISFKPEYNHVKNVRFVLAQAPSDGSGTIEVALYHDKKLLYRGLRACSNITVGEYTDFVTNLILDTSEIYELHIGVNDTELVSETKICGYKESENQTVPLVSTGYSEKLRICDKMLASLFVLLVYVGVVYFIIGAGKYRLKILDFVRVLMEKQKNIQFFSVLFFLLTYLALEISKLAIDISMKLILSLLVFGSTYWLENNWEHVKQKLTEKKNAVVMLVLSIWTAFSLIGSRCFIYPVNKNLMPGALLLFVIAAVLMFPVVAFVTIKTEEFCGKRIKSAENKFPWDFVIVTMVVVLISALYFMRAFNPAISSPDTQHCMYYALNPIKGINDWHPAFYILWLKAIVKIIPAAQAVVAVQYIFFLYVLLRGFLFLYERGMPKGFLYGAMLLTVLNCGNTVHITTIWKDIPYTLSITWLTILAAILLFRRKKKNIYIYIELTIALVYTCLFRQAGVVPFVIVGAALLIVFRKNWKIWVSVGMAVCIVLMIKGPVYTNCEIQTDYGGGVYIGLGQDIMGAYYNGGELSETTIEMVQVLSKSDIASQVYSPYRADSSYSLDVTKGEFIMAYIDTFIKNPIMMTRSIACRMDAVWNIFLGEAGSLGCVAYLGTMDGEKERWVDLWGMRESNFITQRVQEWVAYSVDKPVLNVIEWRSGIWFLMFLFSVGICVYKGRRKKVYLLFVPCLSHVLSLLLSTGWSDFRYYWPVNLMTLFVFTTVMTLKSREGAR